MEHRGRSSGRESRSHAPKEDVVRLPVSESDLSDQLEAMPAPGRRPRMQPTPAVDLHEDEVEEVVEPTPTELGVSWEEDEDVRRHDTPLGWIALIGAILIGLSGWALTKLAKGEEEVEKRSDVVVEGWEKEAQSWVDAEHLFQAVQREARAYLRADDIEEKARFVRHPERVVPLMEAFYERHELKPLVLESIEDFRPFAIEKRPFIYIAAKVEGGRILHLSMEQTAAGGLKFDWESEVAYQPTSLEEYIAKKPTEPVNFRVYAKIDTLYSYEFSDSSRYRALFLTVRDSPEFLFGYIERGTKDEEELLKIFLPEYRIPKPVILRVRFLPGTRARRSVLVEELVSPRWIYAEAPEGGSPQDEGSGSP